MSELKPLTKEKALECIRRFKQEIKMFYGEDKK